MRRKPSNPNRREFLARSVAAVAAPYVITSSALGADDRPPASERITMAMIGCGGRGGMVHRAFLNDARTPCVGVCEVDTQRLARAKKRVDEHHENQDCVEYGDFLRRPT